MWGGKLVASPVSWWADFLELCFQKVCALRAKNKKTFMMCLAWLCRLVSLMHDGLSSLTANENTAVTSHRGGTELLFELRLTSDLFQGGWLNKGGKERKSTDTWKHGLFMPDLNWISIQQLNTAWYGWQRRCTEQQKQQKQQKTAETAETAEKGPRMKIFHYLLPLFLYCRRS